MAMNSYSPIFYCFLLFLNFGCTLGKTEAIEKIDRKILNSSKLNYECTYEIKRLYNSHFESTHSSVSILRDSTIPNLGAEIRIEKDSSLIIFSGRENVYYINHNKKQVDLAHPDVYNISEKMGHKYLLSIMLNGFQITDQHPEGKISIPDSLKTDSTFTIYCEYPAQKDQHSSFFLWEISNKEMLPVRHESQIFEGPESQIVKIHIRYNKPSPEPISLRPEIPEHYKQKTYKRKTPQKTENLYSGLKVGSSFLDFTKTAFSPPIPPPDSMLGKLVIYDYWFKSCMPCQKVFPVLHDIQSNYGPDKIQIISINTIDFKNQQGALEYAKQQKASLPIHFLNRNLFPEYSPERQPLVLIYSPEGKLLKKMVGYNHQFSQEVNDVIASVLN